MNEEYRVGRVNTLSVLITMSGVEKTELMHRFLHGLNIGLFFPPKT